MLGKFFDSAGIFLAAVLTLCGFLLLFLPWNAALSPRPARQAASPGVIYVTTGPAKESLKSQAVPQTQPAK
jgi:uncharacterized SAM-binding protein YcdF (DUF218 family)